MRDNGISWGDSYDLVVQRDDWFYQDYAVILRELADIVVAGTELNSLAVELPVGTANLTALLLEKRSVIGVEPSGEMARIARRRCPGLRIVGGWFRALPFRDASVDAIVSAYGLHRLSREDRIDSIGEMRRVLRRGGHVVVADMMFRDAASERALREDLVQKGAKTKLALLDEESDEYPLFSDLQIEFGRFGFSFSGKQRTELVWLFRAKLR
jgi:ubiquinone/menaquinone biosynthesis C-methylase UbiE